MTYILNTDVSHLVNLNFFCSNSIELITDLLMNFLKKGKFSMTLIAMVFRFHNKINCYRDKVIRQY